MRTRKHANGQTRKRILIVAVNWLGDLLFMTPAIRAIRRAFPESYIACGVPPRGLPLLKGNPHLNAVIPLQEGRGIRNLFHWGSMIRRLRSHRFDTAFLFHRSFSRTAMVWLAGVPRRVGYRTWKRGWLLTEAVDPPENDSVHKVEWFLRLLSAVGIERDGVEYDAGTFSEHDEAAVNRLLEELGVRPGERVVALHAGANWHLKRWPAERFAELADQLSQRLGVAVLFVGGAGDRPLVEGIAGRMRTKPRVAAGRTTFPQLGVLLKRARLLISNDSGPLHLGLAVGTPVVALFGPTSPALTGPPQGTRAITLFGSIGCPVPCYWLACPKNLCLHEISVEQVLDAAQRLLAEGSRLKAEGNFP